MGEEGGRGGTSQPTPQCSQTMPVDSARPRALRWIARLVKRQLVSLAQKAKAVIVIDVAARL